MLIFRTFSLFAVWMLSTVAFILDVAAGTDHGKLYARKPPV